MEANTFDDIDLKVVWAMIIEKMNKEGEELVLIHQVFIKRKMAQSAPCEEKMEI